MRCRAESAAIFLKMLLFLPASSCTISTYALLALCRAPLPDTVLSCLPVAQSTLPNPDYSFLTALCMVSSSTLPLGLWRRASLWVSPELMHPSIWSYLPRLIYEVKCYLRYLSRNYIIKASLLCDTCLQSSCSRSRPFFFLASCLRVGTSPFATISFSWAACPNTSSITVGSTRGRQ